MEYNTSLKELILPEYGRNIHNMVEYCMTLEDKEERTKCAYSIISIMGNMFPHLRDVNDFKHILWDHIAIMSDFKLDIDYPYEIINKEELYSRPKPISYNLTSMKFKHYGKNIEKIIKIIPTIEDKEQKAQLELMVVQQMKKSYYVWNKDVEDSKIFNDLYHMSNGQIDLRESNIKLLETKELNKLMSTFPSNNSNSNNRKKRNK